MVEGEGVRVRVRVKGEGEGEGSRVLGLPTGMALEGSEVTKIRNLVCDPSMAKTSSFFSS